MYGPEFVEPGAAIEPAAPKPVAPTSSDGATGRWQASTIYVDGKGRRRKVTVYGPDKATAEARLAARLDELGISKS